MYHHHRHRDEYGFRVFAAKLNINGRVLWSNEFGPGNGTSLAFDSTYIRVIDATYPHQRMTH